MDNSTLEGEILQILDDTAIDVIECLNNTNPQAKEEFLADPTLLRPRNQYGNLEAGRVRKNLDGLARVKELLASCQISGEKRLVYDAILCDNVKRNQFVLANDLYNTSRSVEEQSLAAEQHRQANLALYGQVDERIFRSILHQKLAAIQERSLQGSDAELYQELIALTGPVTEVSCDFFVPKETTFATFSMWMESFFEGFFRHIPNGPQTFTAHDVCDITNEILREEPNVKGKGWKAVVGADSAFASTDEDKKEIIYPGKRSRGLYSRDDVKKIIAHELGVHALRAMPFDGHPIAALSHGLPGFETFEEGLATAVEQAVVGKFSHPGLLHYVSIGSAVFLRKNFREVFEIQVRLEHLTGGAGPSQCFDSVQRAFRGTGILPNSKDLIYLNGNILVWKFIEDHIDDQPGLLHQLFETGKSDPLSPIYKSLFPELAEKPPEI